MTRKVQYLKGKVKNKKKDRETAYPIKIKG